MNKIQKEIYEVQQNPELAKLELSNNTGLEITSNIEEITNILK